MNTVTPKTKPFMLLALVIVLLLALLLGFAAHGLNATLHPLIAASVALNAIIVVIWLGASLFGRTRAEHAKHSRELENLTKEMLER